MSWESDFAEIIKKDFEARNKKNSSFSQKAYSKKIGLSAAALSGILNQTDNWKISARRASEILKMISISDSKRNKLLVLMGEQPIHQKAVLQPSQNKILTQWYYIPVLIYFDLPEPLRTVHHIAEKLELTKTKVQAVIDELVQLGMLEKISAGEYRRPQVYTSTPDGVTSEMLLKLVEMNLDLSKKMLQKQNRLQRDFTSLTFVGNKEKIDNLRTEIRALYEKASALMDDSANNNAVFRLSVQLSPLEFT